uniref:Integrase catalytic domain-containing protein n=1 Tax=Fagus sylvatica TaxID=28930 RepID=A0A2N9G447_FAGSY
METGDNSAQPLSASERQLQALTANIQELARQSAADRREMQELARQNQELMALLRSRGEIPSPGQGQNGEEIPRNETGRNQSQNHNQNDEGSSANQNREPHPHPHPSQVADPAKSAADARAAKLEEELKEMREQDERDEEPGQGKGGQKPRYARPSLRVSLHQEGPSLTTSLEDEDQYVQQTTSLTYGQREGESLRSYVQRFNKEAVQIDEPNEYVALTAFNAGLLKGDFLFQLCKDPLKSMSELMYEAQKFINAEDAFQARDEFLSRKRKEPEDRRFDSSRNKSSRQDYPKAERKNTSSSNRREERPSSFTPLNMSIDQVLLQIQDSPDIKWPGKLRSDPTKRSKDLYCRFHRDHEVRHEPRPPRQDENKDRQEDRPRDIIGEIRTIVGGLASGGASRSSRKAYARQAHNILVIQRSRKSLKMDDQVISFSEDDARNIHHPYDDALVMKIDKEQLKPIDIPLVGFTGDKVKPLGVVSLIIEAGTYPKQVRTSVEFLVVDCPSAYNVIIGRPTLNKLRAVTSTYHLLVRFPTEHGIGELKGDQATARECYFASLGPEATHQTMKIDEGHKLVEPTEELETHDDMPGIDPATICHKLNVDPSIRPIKQKRRVLAPDRNQAISDEVEKLLTAGFIREVFYPDWLANVVMVKKANGKWRMCVDFTDLNKACPKDSFPLPRIDQLVDSTAGHRLLTFMDAFSGYNQIMMDDADQEKTSFITSKGLFCYKVMPFGLKNAGATYQRLMNKMFHHQIGRNVEVYVDDMLVKTKDERKHLEDLKETFETLRRYRMKLNPNKCVFGVSSGKFLGFMVSQRGIEANPDKIKAVLEMTPPRTTKEVQSLTGRVAALNRFVSRATDKCLPFFKTLRKAFVWTDECQKSFEELKRYLTSPPLLSPSQQGEALSLYLAVSPTAVSSALIREDGGTQLPVYYTSKAFQGAEERYPAMEKLALALHAAGRLIQWAVELSEFDIEYHPRQAIKAQALADFIAEFTVTEDEPSEDKPDEEWEVEIRRVVRQGGRRCWDSLQDTRRTSTQTLHPTPISHHEQRGRVRGPVNQPAHARPRVPREQNTEADALAKLASSDEATDQYIEVQHSPSHLEEEISPINVSNSWMTPIVNYLEDETLPSDPVEARKLKARSTRFHQADYVMREVHEGICGNHSGARSLVHKIVRAGYYWPTMQKDAVSYVRACDKCQRFGNLIHSPPETLTPMTAPWPFAQWGLDIMGPLPVGRRQLKFLVVGIDYFTKWVEAEPLATITERNIRAFVWKAIICRFGIPRAFISDNGRQFDNSPFREFCEELGIHNHYSSPGHPQANGQVEVTNRSLLKMIKTRLEGAKGLWPEELPNILWAYRTTARTPTGETPFRLTYGTEAVIPVEIGLTTWRTNNYDEESNDDQLRSNLDLVDEVRDQAEARTRVYQQRMARYYDRRVKHREFKVGDLVLRKVTLATKDPAQGKLGPTWEGPYRVVKFHRRGTYHLEKLDGDALPHPWNAEHLKKYYHGVVIHLRDQLANICNVVLRQAGIVDSSSSNGWKGFESQALGNFSFRLASSGSLKTFAHLQLQMSTSSACSSDLLLAIVQRSPSSPSSFLRQCLPPHCMQRLAITVSSVRPYTKKKNNTHLVPEETLGPTTGQGGVLEVASAASPRSLLDEGSAGNLNNLDRRGLEQALGQTASEQEEEEEGRLLSLAVAIPTKRQRESPSDNSRPDRPFAACSKTRIPGEAGIWTRLIAKQTARPMVRSSFPSLKTFHITINPTTVLQALGANWPGAKLRRSKQAPSSGVAVETLHASVKIGLIECHVAISGRTCYLVRLRESEGRRPQESGICVYTHPNPSLSTTFRQIGPRGPRGLRPNSPLTSQRWMESPSS